MNEDEKFINSIISRGKSSVSKNVGEQDISFINTIEDTSINTIEDKRDSAEQPEAAEILINKTTQSDAAEDKQESEIIFEPEIIYVPEGPVLSKVSQETDDSQALEESDNYEINETDASETLNENEFSAESEKIEESEKGEVSDKAEISEEFCDFDISEISDESDIPAAADQAESSENPENPEITDSAETDEQENSDECDEESLKADDRNGGHYSAFEASLDQLKPEDLGPERKKESVLGKTVFWIRAAIFCVLLGVMITSGYIMIKDNISHAKGGDYYNNLKASLGVNAESSSLTAKLKSSKDDINLPNFSKMLSGDFVYNEVITGDEKEKLALYKTKLNKLKGENPDTFGWMVLPGTNINYPVVKGSDNDFYLKHTFEKEYNAIGALFVDYRCSPVVNENRNIVIYGHNIRTQGLMFNTLVDYEKKGFFDANPYIYIYTLEGFYTYEVFSFYQTKENDPYALVAFGSDAMYLSYCKTAKENSMYVREGIELTAESKLLTLSTCTNGEKDDRYAVHAVQISFTPYN